MEAWLEKIDPEHHFSFRWHPGSVDPNVDYSKEPTTLVVFTLEDDDDGTKLTVVETGFDALPESRRAKRAPLSCQPKCSRATCTTICDARSMPSHPVFRQR